jgi:hypothetical protein
MRSDLPRILTVSLARQLNISRSRVRTEVAHGQWRSIARGFVLTRPDQPTRQDWAAIGLLAAGAGPVLSGWDAARYYGLGDTVPPAAPVLVLTHQGMSRRIGAVTIRRVAEALASRTISINDEHLPLGLLAEPSRAVIDAAMTYRSLAPVRALLTSAIQKSVCSPADLCAQVPNVARRGSALVRHALEDVLDGAHSEAEAKALTALRRADVPPFELNVAVLDSRGRIIAVVDVLWRALRAVLEVDSRQFHFSQTDWHRTSDRHNRLTAGGLAVQHYPPARFVFGGSWLGEVITWLRARARESGVEYRADPRPLRNGPPLRLSPPC